MKVSATDFRKNMFRIMDKAVQGELVEVLHKGNTVRLEAIGRPSKISALVRRDTLVCSAEEVGSARRELHGEMQAKMEKNWTEI